MNDPVVRKRRRFALVFLRSIAGALLLMALVWVGVDFLFTWTRATSKWAPWARGVAELWTSLVSTALLGWAWGHLMRGHRRDPFRPLNEALLRIAGGDFSVQVEVSDRDGGPENHFQTLAANLNTMTEALARMEDLRRRFVADVSHEFQSPLTSILGFAQALRSAQLPAELRQRYLGIIEDEARRLSRLSDNLLKLNALEDRDGPPDPVSFRLDVQIRRVLVALEPQWSSKALEIEADLPETTVTGNEELWAQVWTNLVHNAVKFTPAGGRVTVRIVPGPPVDVEVEDNGIGLTSEESDRVFERFYKAESARTHGDGAVGSGLGLALVQRISALHGASAQALSPGLGRGTILRISFPLS